MPVSQSATSQRELDRIMRTPPISETEKSAARALDNLNREQRKKNRSRVFSISTF